MLGGFEDAGSLIYSLEDVLRRLGVAQLLEADLDEKDLVNLRGEMITPGRSDNFILPVTDDLLDMIIRRG